MLSPVIIWPHFNQILCKQNAMKLVSMAEAQPKLSKLQTSEFS